MWKLFRLSGNFPGYQKIFHIIRKISSLSGNFPGCSEIFLSYLKIFQIIWKISSLFGNFPGYRETFWTIWKISTLYGYFPKGQETSQCNDNATLPPRFLGLWMTPGGTEFTQLLTSLAASSPSRIMSAFLNIFEMGSR